MGTIKQFRDPLLITDGSMIGFYEREFYVFSNFSSFQVKWQGRLWPTSEHAYHAAKFFKVTEDLVEEIAKAPSAHEAAKIAEKYREKRRADWADVKIEIMLDICCHKLKQHEYVQAKLRQTNDEYLVEDSPKDSFWGWGPDKQGRNELGRIWMKLREELKTW